MLTTARDVVDEDVSEVGFARAQSRDGGVDLAERTHGDGGADLVSGAEFEHLNHVLFAPGVTRCDVVHGEAESEDVGLDGRAHADETNRPTRA